MLSNGRVIAHCIHVLHLLYPSLCWWTFRLLPCLGYCKQCCNEHWGACTLLDHVFLWIYAQKWHCSIFSFLRNLHTIPHSGYTNWWVYSWRTYKSSVGNFPLSYLMPYTCQLIPTVKKKEREINRERIDPFLLNGQFPRANDGRNWMSRSIKWTLKSNKLFWSLRSSTHLISNLGQPLNPLSLCVLNSIMGLSINSIYLLMLCED